MGIFTGLVTLPLAPLRGAAWVVQQVADEAERQLYDEASLRRELLQLELDNEAGLLESGEYESRADEILERIAEARAPRESFDGDEFIEGTDG